ncbi:hypothetical protein DUNSADRAFT_15407, partial [Dunaliella salina]
DGRSSLAPHPQPPPSRQLRALDGSARLLWPQERPSPQAAPPALAAVLAVSSTPSATPLQHCQSPSHDQQSAGSTAGPSHSASTSTAPKESLPGPSLGQHKALYDDVQLRLWLCRRLVQTRDLMGRGGAHQPQPSNPGASNGTTTASAIARTLLDSGSSAAATTATAGAPLASTSSGNTPTVSTSAIDSSADSTSSSLTTEAPSIHQSHLSSKNEPGTSCDAPAQASPILLTPTTNPSTPFCPNLNIPPNEAQVIPTLHSHNNTSNSPRALQSSLNSLTPISPTAPEPSNNITNPRIIPKGPNNLNSPNSSTSPRVASPKSPYSNGILVGDGASKAVGFDASRTPFSLGNDSDSAPFPAGPAAAAAAAGAATSHGGPGVELDPLIDCLLSQVQSLMQEKSTLAAHMHAMSDEQEKLQERLAYLLLPEAFENGDYAGLVYSDDGGEDQVEDLGDDLFYSNHAHDSGQRDPYVTGRAQLLQGHKRRVGCSRSASQLQTSQVLLERGRGCPGREGADGT